MHKQSLAQKREFRFSFSLVCALNKNQEDFILFLMSSFQCWSRGEAVCWGSFKKTIIGSFMPKNNN